MERAAGDDILEEWLRSLSRPAEDPELALRGADIGATLPPERIALHVPRILDALGTRFRVTGGDAAVDRAAEVLARLDPRTLVAAVEETTRSLEGGERARFLRDLDGLALACPALLPVLDALAPTSPPARDGTFEAEVARFGSYVDMFFEALAEEAALGSLGAWKAAVRARLRSPKASDPYTSLPWAALGLCSTDEVNTIDARIGGAVALAPNVEIRSFEVHTYKRVVEAVRDPATEVTRAALREEHEYPYADDIELGEEMGLLDGIRTRALRAAALRALGMG